MNEEDKKVIKEFIDETPKYIVELERCSMHNGTCSICGMSVKNIKKLLEAVKKIQL